MLLAAPTWANNVYYGGMEDSVNGDYDYNDLVFSLSGNGLTLHTATGQWFPEPANLYLNANDGTPFWNNLSWDGTYYNIGFCIYGDGGMCGPGLAPNAQYLAAPGDGHLSQVNDVYFTVSGPVTLTIYDHIAGDTDLLGWYSLAAPSTLYTLSGSSDQTGTFSFNPGGAFGLVGFNTAPWALDTYFSQTSQPGDTADPYIDGGSHFAFFATPVPEPGSVVLMGTALLGISLLLRRRNRQNAR